MGSARSCRGSSRAPRLARTSTTGCVRWPRSSLEAIAGDRSWAHRPPRCRPSADGWINRRSGSIVCRSTGYVTDYCTQSGWMPLDPGWTGSNGIRLHPGVAGGIPAGLSLRLRTADNIWPSSATFGISRYF